MFNINRASDRGIANFGWLDSRHTFSFGGYYDPNKMGFSSLRVINDDKVKPGAGFSTHSHRDMEIISYVLEGQIAHKDSEGNIQTLPAGEFQLMSAGSGIQHSEFNPSEERDLRFLQIWIQPNELGKNPDYQQKSFGQEQGLTLVVSPDGEADSFTIKQDAKLYQLFLETASFIRFPLSQNRNYYVHVINGELLINDRHLKPGDGLEISLLSTLNINSLESKVQALIFDLP
jgi:quercetin 2,3-dioxygenase